MGKRKAALEEKRRFSNKQLTIFSIIAVSIIVLGSILSFIFPQKPNKFSLNAAIIDQLEENFPNPQFVSNVTSILEAAGFNVTHHKSEELDVNFFKGLASYDYGLIILRGHSALRKDNLTVDLFTSEEFASNKYLEEQEKELLTRGRYLWEPNKFYFAITPKFIENLEERFPKSVIIAMGCWSLKPECEEMAEAFIRKGAKIYSGWTGLVGINHTDDETIELLKMLLEENKTIADAVANTTPDWDFPPGSKMEYLPQTAGSLKLPSLIEEAKASSNKSGVTLFEPASTVCVTSFFRLKMKKKFRFDSC